MLCYLTNQALKQFGVLGNCKRTNACGLPGGVSFSHKPSFDEASCVEDLELLRDVGTPHESVWCVAKCFSCADLKGVKTLRHKPKIGGQVFASFVTSTIEIIPVSTNLFSPGKMACWTFAGW